MTRIEAKRPGGPAFGILLLDKPAGPTSHDAVAWARWALRERSVGHCGTLDPAATGLLVVCVGAATKLVEYLTGVDKRYLGRFVLGRATTTDDADGEVTATAPVSAEAIEQARAAVAGLHGALELEPPAYSSVKVDGQRAHALARAGEAPSLAPRPMVVDAMTVVGSGPDWVEADLRVSKGTYVRSLALELGRRVGLPAHLGALRRLACGELGLDHPRAVTGLRAEPLPPRPAAPNAAPHWRIHVDAPAGPAGAPPAGEADERDATGAVLRAHLLAPWECLPFASTVFGPDPDERPLAHAKPLFDRFAEGQWLRADARTLARLGLSAAPSCELHALVDRAGGRMFIVRHEPDAGRLAPTRLIRFPAGTPA